MSTLTLLFNCLATAVICALLSGIAVFWISVSSNQEGSDAALGRAFAMIMGPLAGALLGLVVGLFGSLLLAQPTYLRLLGIAGALTVALCIASVVFVWKTGDREPTVDGKPLDLEFELKTPTGFRLPSPSAERPRFELYGNDISAGNFPLDLTHTTASDGGWIIYDYFPLKTRRAEKSLNISLNPGLIEEKDSQLRFSINGEPSKTQFNWSPWIAATNSPRFQLRYKLRTRTQLVKDLGRGARLRRA